MNPSWRRRRVAEAQRQMSASAGKAPPGKGKPVGDDGSRKAGGGERFRQLDCRMKASMNGVRLSRTPVGTLGSGPCVRGPQ